MSTSIAVGISIGSENCVVATSNTPGRFDVSANDAGDRVTPTYVAVVAGEMLFASGAKNALIRYPMQTVPCLLPMTNLELVNENKFRVACEVEVKEDEDKVVFPSLDADDSDVVHEASNLLTQFLIRFKESVVDGACGNAAAGAAVFSVPRYMPTDGIASIAEAAGYTGKLQVLYNDVAAAMAYGFGSKEPSAECSGKQLLLVIDWGANTLCASILASHGGALDYHRHLVSYNAGGKTIDKEIQQQIAQLFQRKTRLDPNDNARAMRRLLLQAEEKKKILSTAVTTSFEIEAFCEGIDLKEPLSRVKLESMIRDKNLGAACDKLISDLLDDASTDEELADSQIQTVIFSGGTLRNTLLAGHVKAFVQKSATEARWGNFLNSQPKVLDSIPSDEVCAIGACAQSSILVQASTKTTSATTSLPSTPQSVKCLSRNVYLLVGQLPAGTTNADDGCVSVPAASVNLLCQAGTPLPCEATLEFSTPLSNDQLVALMVSGTTASKEGDLRLMRAQKRPNIAKGSKKATLIFHESQGSLLVHVLCEAADGKKSFTTKGQPIEVVTAE